MTSQQLLLKRWRVAKCSIVMLLLSWNRACAMLMDLIHCGVLPSKRLAYAGNEDNFKDICYRATTYFLFTARKQSLRRLCFHICLFVHVGEGGRGVWIQGDLQTSPHQILRDMVNERAVRILLECILVSYLVPLNCRQCWNFNSIANMKFWSRDFDGTQTGSNMDPLLLLVVCSQPMSFVSERRILQRLPPWKLYNSYWTHDHSFWQIILKWFFYVHFEICCVCVCSDGSKGGARHAPSGGPNSFNFMQFLGKFGKIVCWRPPGELEPPPRGNPGSATGVCVWTSVLL